MEGKDEKYLVEGILIPTTTDIGRTIVKHNVRLKNE